VKIAQRLWDIHDGTCWKILQGHENKVWAVALAPGVRCLLAAVKKTNSEDFGMFMMVKCIELCNIEMGCGQLLLITQGTTLASGSHDQTINLGYGNTGQALKNLAGTSRMGMVNCLYSDGKTLVSGGDDSLSEDCGMQVLVKS